MPTEEDQASWVGDFETRRLTAMIALFEAAVSEYQREVASSVARMHLFLWLPAVRWIVIGAQLVFTTHLDALRLAGFVCHAVTGLVIEIGGILIILRGRAYYRAARDHMVLCAEQVRPGDWSPANTRRAESRVWKVRTITIAILIVFILGDLSLFAWALAGGA